MKKLYSKKLGGEAVAQLKKAKAERDKAHRVLDSTSEGCRSALS